MSINAYGVRALKDLGIDPGKLGCVMLDVTTPDLAGVIPDEWCYTSAHPDRFWVSGRQSEGHVTLLYGLLSPATDIRPAIDEVLDGWEPGPVQGDEITVFPSPWDDEPYSCIVSELALTPQLRDAHARLSLLPHIDTHPVYRPHVTLAYVHEDREQDAVAAIRRHFKARDLFCPINFEPLGLNYGSKR